MVKKVAIIGVPMDLGANRRGVDMGPSAIRVTNLAEKISRLKIDVIDKGDIEVSMPETAEPGDLNKKYSSLIKAACDKLCNSLHGTLKEGRTPIVLGGDHSIAMGSISGVSKYYKEQNKQPGLIWIDAHGDMNVPWSTESGNVHGMPLSHVLGLGDPELNEIGGFTNKIDANKTCLIGIRDLDEREKDLIKKSGIRVFTMKEIDRTSLARVTDEAIKITSDGTAGIHISFDIDAVDPSFAVGVGTPKKGGFNYREAHLIMELVADTGLLTSLDMVEVNPILDVKNSTAELASELILSALGKNIF